MEKFAFLEDKTHQEFQLAALLKGRCEEEQSEDMLTVQNTTFDSISAKRL